MDEHWDRFEPHVQEALAIAWSLKQGETLRADEALLGALNVDAEHVSVAFPLFAELVSDVPTTRRSSQVTVPPEQIVLGPALVDA